MQGVSAPGPVDAARYVVGLGEGRSATPSSWQMSDRGLVGERDSGEDKLLLFREIFKLLLIFSSSEYRKIVLFFKVRCGKIPELLESSRSVRISLKTALVLPLPMYQPRKQEYCSRVKIQEF